MKLRVIYNTRLVRKGYSAWVLYPFIFFRQKQEAVSDSLFRHEMEHVYQVMRMGWWTFYFKYLYYLWKLDYDDIPFEMAAHAMQDLVLTPTERRFKDKL